MEVSNRSDCGTDLLMLGKMASSGAVVQVGVL